MIGFLLWLSGVAVGVAVTYAALWRQQRRAMDANAELVRAYVESPLTTGPPVLPSDSGFPLRGARYDPDLPKPVHRRMTDDYVHPRVYGVTAHALAAEVIEPVRTEVYRPRHLVSGEDTVAILPGDGDFTQELKRLTAGYYASAASHVRQAVGR
jgi:hypothetical protein